MSSWDFLLAGLPEDPGMWQSRALLLYLVILSVLDALAGFVSTRMISASEIFYLPRSGYCRWYRHVLKNLSKFVIGYSVILFILTIPSHSNFRERTIAMLMFALNALTLAWLQTIMIASFGNVLIGFSSLLLIQFVSLYCSKRLLSSWKLLLPGNWAMPLRSSLAASEGFPVSYAICIELTLLLLMWCCGWRLVRQIKRRL